MVSTARGTMFLALPAIFAVFSAIDASAAPRVTASTNEYAITGTKPSLTSASLRQALPTDGGQRFLGHTQWSIKYRFQTTPSASGCRVVSAHANVNIVHTLPQWKDRAGASPAAQAQWDHYSRALARHEQGHAAIAIKHAHRIETALNLIAGATCAEVNGAANQRAQHILAEVHRENAAYDRQTDHGRTQGATHPFR